MSIATLHLNNDLFININLNAEEGLEIKRNSYYTEPLKKRKMKKIAQSTPNQMLEFSEEDNDMDEFESNGIIEVDSVSSHNLNTRLKLNSESSSEFIVSSSTRSTSQEPLKSRFKKNALPFDNFERYLNDISKKYPEMTYEDRVLSWKYSNDVSDIEEYIQDRQDIVRYPRKIQIENRINTNKRKTSLNSKELKRYTAIEILNMENNKTQDITTTEEPNSIKLPENNVEDDNVLLSINTQTKKIYKNNILIDKKIENNFKSGSSSSILFINSTLQRQNNINTENNNIIQSRAVYKQNLNNYTENSKAIDKNCILNKNKCIEICTNFSSTSRIPISIMETAAKTCETTPKEEFYKYLGLETKSPNHKTKNNVQDASEKNNKSSVGRITRLQREKITKLVKHDRLSNYKRNNNKKRNFSKTSIEPKIKIVYSKSSPLSSPEEHPRRSCGCIIKSKVIDNVSLVSHMGKINKTEEGKKRNKIPKSEKITNSNTNTNSYNIRIIETHSYGHKMEVKNDSPLSKKFSHDFSNIISKKFSQQKNKPVLTLFDESKIHPIAKNLYEKYLKMKEVMNKKIEISILMRNFDGMNEFKEMVQCEEVEMNKNDSLKVFNSDCSTIDEYFQDKKPTQRCEVTIKRLKKQCLTKSYQRLLNNKNFIRFLRKNRNKISKKICIGSKRKQQCNIKPKKIMEKTVDIFENKSNHSMLSPIHTTQIINLEENNEQQLENNISMEIIEKKKTKEKTGVIYNNNLDNRDEIQTQNKQINDESGLSSTSIITQNTFKNPLKLSDGDVLHIFYEQNLLIVVQEFLISFWKYSKILQIMAKSQEWKFIGQCKRELNDEEVLTPFKNRLCVSDGNPIYIEVRARQFARDNARECNMSSVYVNVYNFNITRELAAMYSVHLDTIRGPVNSIMYTSIINSRYFVMCWMQEGVLGTNLSGICKYALTPDLDTLASIRDFKCMRHLISQLDCIDDEKIIAFGKSHITLWDHRTGDIIINFDTNMLLGKNLGSVLSTLESENYLFLYQLCNDRQNTNNEVANNECDNEQVTENNTVNTSNGDENIRDNNDKEEIISNLQQQPLLKIICLTLTHSNPKCTIVHSHKLPLSFLNIESSICTIDYLIVTAKGNNEEFLLLPNKPEQIYFIKYNKNYHLPSTSNDFNINRNFCTNGSHNFIEFTNDTLNVKSFYHYLLNFKN